MSDSINTGNKGRVLFLQQYMLEHTDDEHSVNTEELIRIYEEHGYKANRHTIRDDIAVLNEYGVEIIGERQGNGKVYHIGSRLFELAELRMLVDAVSSSRFITKNKSDILIEKLTKLTNEENRPSLTAKIFTADQIKTTNPRVFLTIDIICRAITAGKKISFHYIAYTPQKQRVLRDEGRQYTVSPFALIWNDDRYYLAAQYKQENSVVTFRIDRINDVEILEENAIRGDSFNPSEYASKTLLMYDDGVSEQTVTLLSENKLMQNVIDKFGEEIETNIVDDEHFSAKVTVRPSRTFFSWVFGFCGGIRILSPQSVRRDYEELLRRVLSEQMEKE